MSEFKYACPVCGQHIKCDSSQSGSVMECPTCLQKIVAPQAPSSPDQKFILSGRRLGDGSLTQILARPLPAPARSPFPLAAVALVVLLIGTATAAVVFRDQLFKSSHHPAPAPVVSQAPSPPADTLLEDIPHASDTNWLASLDGVAFPETPAAGRIHGVDFLCDRAYFQNGALTLRLGNKGAPEFALSINFNGAQADALAGKSINIATNTHVAAPVTLRWKDGDQTIKDSFDTGYALRLAFGSLDDNHVAGKIYFCAGDAARSYVAGTFLAEIRKGKPVKPIQ